jgi:hypothetical protein
MADEREGGCRPEGCENCWQLGRYCAELGSEIRCADVVARFGFDDADRPQAGTPCVPCYLLGHWCPAKGYAGVVELCLACGRGELCEQAVAVETMRAGMDDLETVYPAPACRVIPITEADRTVSAPVASDWKIKAELDPANLRPGMRRNERAPLKVHAKTKLRVCSSSKKPERVKEKPVMGTAVKVKATRRQWAQLGEFKMAAVSPEEVPAPSRGVTSPFQEIHEAMYKAFGEGKALAIELASPEIAMAVGKSCICKGKRDGVKVRMMRIEGSKLWLMPECAAAKKEQ